MFRIETCRSSHDLWITLNGGRICAWPGLRRTLRYLSSVYMTTTSAPLSNILNGTRKSFTTNERKRQKNNTFLSILESVGAALILSSFPGLSPPVVPNPISTVSNPEKSKAVAYRSWLIWAERHQTRAARFP